MNDVKVGALVEVTLHGEVVERHTGGSIVVKVGDGLENRSYWIPAGASVTVLSPPRPTEVLLLECGHVQHQLTSPAEVGETVYCWRFPCHTQKSVVRVGSVNW